MRPIAVGTPYASADRVVENETADSLNRITGLIIGAGIEVHREHGPGLLESAYLPPLVRALAARGLAVQTEAPIQQPGLQNCARRYRPDLIVEKCVIVEIKAVDRILPVHAAQLRTYLHLCGCRVGLILNFNSALLKDGIKRVVNHFPDDLGTEANPESARNRNA